MTIPNKSAIANYWMRKVHTMPYEKIKEDAFLSKLLSVEFDVPECFACAKKSQSASSSKNFNKAKFLERCHMIPKSLGGSDDASNLVLLCKACHKEAPDIKDPKWFKQWFINKKPLIKEQFERYASIDRNAIEYALIFVDDFKEYLMENCTTHAGDNDYPNLTHLYAIEAFYEVHRDQA